MTKPRWPVPLSMTRRSSRLPVATKPAAAVVRRVASRSSRTACTSRPKTAATSRPKPTPATVTCVARLVPRRRRSDIPPGIMPYAPEDGPAPPPILRPMPTDDGLRASILAIWDRGRDRALARVEVVEAAVAALPVGGPDARLRASARAEAHKLSGALGTFGMPEGSEHARALELAFEGNPAPAAHDELAAHAEALRAIVEAGPTL